MSKRLLGPRTKFERSEEHFNQFYGCLRTFLNRKPYEVFVEDEAATGDKIYRVRVREDPPPRFAAMVGDVVHNLRSALDLLACQLVYAGGGKPGDNTMFPIRRTKKSFETYGLTLVDGASPEALRILKKLKPYQRGNRGLWRLNRLDANDKHNLLVVLGLAQPRVFIPLVPNADPAAIPGLQLTIKQRRFPLVDGKEIWRVPATVRNTPLDHDPQFICQVALSDGEVVKGEPVIPVLNDLGRLVEETIDLFAPLL